MEHQPSMWYSLSAQVTLTLTKGLRGGSSVSHFFELRLTGGNQVKSPSSQVFLLTLPSSFHSLKLDLQERLLPTLLTTPSLFHPQPIRKGQRDLYAGLNQRGR